MSTYRSLAAILADATGAFGPGARPLGLGVRASFGLGVCAALALALAVPGVAQGASRWSQTYGGPATYEQPLALHELPDHTILVGGVTDSYGTASGDAWRIRIDGDGAVLEERVFGNALQGGAADIAFDADGGMTVVGAHMIDLFTDRDAWIHHVDAGGNIDWEWNLDFDPGMHFLYAVEATSDGGVIAAGSTAIDMGAPIWAWIVKFDGEGNVTWQRRYGGGGAEIANFVVETDDGGYAIAGSSSSFGAGFTDVWLLKISSEGAIEWQKTYGGADQEEATGLIQTSDGGYALSAYTNTYAQSGHGAWVLRLDAGGDVLWHAVLGDEWGDFRDIVQTADGDLVATGRISAPSSNELWAVKFRDANGAVLWQRAYEGTEGDWGSRTIELSGGDLLIGGVWGFGFASEDIWIQRTDASGSIPSCDLIRDTSVIARSPVVTVGPAGATVSDPTPSPEAITFVSGVSDASVDEKCRSVTGAGEGDPSQSPADWLIVRPNPLQGAGTVALRLEKAGRIRLDLLDASGRRVATLADGVYPSGEHHVAWEESRHAHLAGGVYFLALSGEHGSAMKRAVLLR